jgi:hypothetical protein
MVVALSGGEPRNVVSALVSSGLASFESVASVVAPTSKVAPSAWAGGSV